MSRRSKRAPKVQDEVRDTTDHRRFPFIYRWNTRSAGMTGHVCVYCGNAITWEELKADEVQMGLPQSPRLVGPRHVDAHRWCRLKAILGPKRARHHR